MIKYILIFISLLSYQSFAQKVDKKEILHPKTDSVVNSWLKSNIKLAKKLKDNNSTLRYHYRLEDDTTLECRCGISEALFLLEKNRIAYKHIGRYDFNTKSFPVAVYRKYGLKLSFEGCVAKTQTKCFNRVMDSVIIRKWGKEFNVIFDEVEKEMLFIFGNNYDNQRDKFRLIDSALHKAAYKYVYCELPKTKKFGIMGTIVIDNKGKLCSIEVSDTSETSRKIINFIKIYWQKLMKNYDFEKEIGKWCEMKLFLKYDEKIKCE
jgi:hypothetical protein